tara:strand:- start:219 stop:1361 length:1143 start_codon:yes stop_codon:yes gene_type:complete
MSAKAEDYDTKEVLVTGNISMYKATAYCQIQINDITEYGEGALKKAIEKIRIKLEKEGLFKNKKEFPAYPRNIGIITSADSHALQDVLSKLKHRFPLANIIIYPSLVQGNEAAKNIISQLQISNKEKYADVLMLIRGGGSLEDLMVFNDEDLAREIYKSSIPIVTGIGHQPDVTIADYVADASMETPTAAAVFITPDKYELAERLLAYDEQIKSNALIRLSKLKDKCSIIINNINLYHPKNIIDNLKIRHKEIYKALNSQIKLFHNEISSETIVLINRFNKSREVLDKKYSDAQNIIIENKRLIEKRGKELFKDKYQEYKRLHQELVLSDPASALKKGYSIIRDSSGIILKEKSQIQDNQILSAEFKDGCVKVKKVSIKK